MSEKMVGEIPPGYFHLLQFHFFGFFSSLYFINLIKKGNKSFILSLREFCNNHDMGMKAK